MLQEAYRMRYARTRLRAKLRPHIHAHVTRTTRQQLCPHTDPAELRSHEESPSTAPTPLVLPDPGTVS